MSPTEVFTISNTIVVPMWFLMIIAPKWNVTRFLIDYKVFPVILSILYAAYIIQSIINGPAMDFSSLQAVMHLFTIEQAVLAGWLHYLIFDMLVGMWMVNENTTLKLHPLVMAVCLLGAFLIGPIGFLLFMGLKVYRQKKELQSV